MSAETPTAQSSANIDRPQMTETRNRNAHFAVSSSAPQPPLDHLQERTNPPDTDTEAAELARQHFAQVQESFFGAAEIDAMELTPEPHRKWKRIFTLHIRYDSPPFYFDEIMPEVLEGKLSNFIFTQRIKSVNELLQKQGEIRDVSHIWRNGVSLFMLTVTIVVMAVMNQPSFPIYFGVLLILFVMWSFVQAWAAIEPKYERDVRELCKSWTQDDVHLHLAYISRRSMAARPSAVSDAIKSIFIPAETDWFLVIHESVPIFPVQVFGAHREDGSGWTAATVDTTHARALPAYIPPWDATPAPEYCIPTGDVNSEIQLAESSATLLGTRGVDA
ncbi:hypothetical protein BDR26DRAFT_855933 [Obelidium mucronatum]|nr:hypothetical protein BDR26DRAFT_855933 [Obelidium mucronatum]